MLWRHPAVRLLLLVLAFGVAGMHTLGHHEGHDGQSSATGHTVHAEPPAADGTAAVTPPTGDMNPSQMCLAVLTAGALLGLALVAARVIRRVAASHWRPRLRTASHTTRGPPGPTRTGLLTVKVAVLRI